MKVLFANPFFFAQSELERRFKTFYFPLGLLYLAAVTREAGHQVTVFDGTFAPGLETFSDALNRHGPDLVCIASWITVKPTALRLAGMAAARDLPVIMGGPGPTAEPAAYLQHPEVEFVALGEGERTMVELLESLASGHSPIDVRGLVLRDDDGRLTHTGPRKLIHDLDRLPLPARDLIDVHRYLDMWEMEHGYRSLTIAVTRGCPDEGCPYCVDSVMGRGLRRRSVDDIVGEMRDLQDTYSIDRFRLVDDLNRLSRDWLMALGEAMIAAGVTTPYEGLNTVTQRGLPMLAPTRDICHERNAWIPTQGRHGHAPPTADEDLLRRRWQDALLLNGEHLEDP